MATTKKIPTPVVARAPVTTPAAAPREVSVVGTLVPTPGGGYRVDLDLQPLVQAIAQAMQGGVEKR